MTVHWQRNYTQLPKGLYSASVEDHHWEGWYIFRAYPSMGSCCTEFMSKDLDEVIAKADAWEAAGYNACSVPGMYSASF